VLAISHKATLRILGAALTGAPIGKYRTRWPQDECALNLIELRAGKEPFLRLWNDTSHLGPDPAGHTRGGK
jgi:broad specificity phosphatase PhoE